MDGPRTFRALTLNCWNVSVSFYERMAIIRRGLLESEPDVVGLQEIVVRSDGLDQGSMLFDDSGYARVFGPAVRWNDVGTRLAHDADGSGFGNLIASRWPIVHTQAQPLPRMPREEPRSAFGALSETPAGIVPVVTTHLDWEFDPGWVRERQVCAVATFARALAKTADFPPVVVGDFNAHPDSTEMRFLRGLTSIDG